MSRVNTYLTLQLSLLICLCLGSAETRHLHAQMVSLTPSEDNTLYEYDPADMDSPFNSNGSGDYVSAGRTQSRGLIRRGLIQFDFSGLPTDAMVVAGTAQLTLEVVDAPKKDTSGEPRDFWLVPLSESWGEGMSEANAGVSGSGSGAAAMNQDATWLHTMYDDAIHDPRNPNFTDSGYWSQVGALGNNPLDPTIYGEPAGTVPAAPYLGPVTFASTAMEGDINAWLSEPATNFGWIVLGDERIADANRSSNRGFASREDADQAPLLTFDYVIVPEPSSLLILLTGLVFYGRRRNEDGGAE